MLPNSGDIFRKYPPRNKVENRELRAKYVDDETSLKKYGLKLDPPFTDIFKYCDVHSIIAPDLLHQVSKMLYDDLYKWLTAYLSLIHKESKSRITAEIDARFSRIPPYPGLKHFSKGLSCTERWTGNEYKAMARVLLPIIEDLLSPEMTALVRAYLNIIQLSHYTSHTSVTVEYLRRAINEYTKHRSGADGPLVDLDIIAKGYFTPKQHSIQHYDDWIPWKGPLTFCSTDRTEALHKLHKEDYRKSNKTASWEDFVLRHEARRVAIEWFESTLAPELVVLPPGTRKRASAEEVDQSLTNNFESVEEDAGESDGLRELDDLVMNVNGNAGEADDKLPGIQIRLGGKRWTHSRDINYVETDLQLPNFSVETRKCLRWIRTKRPSCYRLEKWEENEVIQIEGHTMARIQYPAVHDTMEIISEIIRSTEGYQYHQNRNWRAARFDTVLIRWEKDEGSHAMSNRRIGRVLLLFSAIPGSTGHTIGMAYVEWMRVTSNKWDGKTEMFKVARSNPPEYMVVDIESIERGCHLVPCFEGFDTRMAGKPEFTPGLNEYTHFWINNWIDRHMYNTIYADVSMWKISKSLFKKLE
jgi:hypothetical protein